jgi:hypothetical protein
MNYTLEVYDVNRPGASDCLEAFESATPFMAFNKGDTYILFPAHNATGVTVEKVTHIVWDAGQGLCHKIMLYVKPD